MKMLWVPFCLKSSSGLPLLSPHSPLRNRTDVRQTRIISFTEWIFLAYCEWLHLNDQLIAVTCSWFHVSEWKSQPAGNATPKWSFDFRVTKENRIFPGLNLFSFTLYGLRKHKHRFLQNMLWTSKDKPKKKFLISFTVHPPNAKKEFSKHQERFYMNKTGTWWAIRSKCLQRP